MPATHVVIFEDAEGITYREYHPSEESAKFAANLIATRVSRSGIIMQNVRVEPAEAE